MYNGIGLTTPRGSGTNGYVVRNLSTLRTRETAQDRASAWDAAPPKHREPDEGILDHERKRQVEVKCLELQLELEDNGIDEAQIEEQVGALREKLLANLAALAPSAKSLKASDTHGLAAAKKSELDKMARALGTRRDYQEGEAFDREKQEEKKMQRMVEREERERRKDEERARMQEQRNKWEAEKREKDRLRRREEDKQRQARLAGRKDDMPPPALPGGRGRDYDNKPPPDAPRGPSASRRNRSPPPRRGRSDSRSPSPPRQRRRLDSRSRSRSRSPTSPRRRSRDRSPPRRYRDSRSRSPPPRGRRDRSQDSDHSLQRLSPRVRRRRSRSGSTGSAMSVSTRSGGSSRSRSRERS